MPLVPYTPDSEAWIEHYKYSDSDKNVQPLKPREKIVSMGDSKVELKIVSPTAQTVERAKALMEKKMKKTVQAREPE